MALTQLKTGAIADDAVTTDKLANAINTARDANTAKTTNATHTGEVTGSGALTIADDIVDEANLKVSNSPTNGQFLSAQSGNTGGLTWASVSTDTDFALFRGNTGFSGGADPIVNWTEMVHTVTITESSGIFSFPSTGFWEIYVQLYGYYNNDSDNAELHIMTTTNDSSYTTRSQSYTSLNNDDGGNLYTHINAAHIFDVSNTSNHKVKFKTANTSINWAADSSRNETYAIFKRLGDT